MKSLILLVGWVNRKNPSAVLEFFLQKSGVDSNSERFKLTTVRAKLLPSKVQQFKECEKAQKMNGSKRVQCSSGFLS